MTRTTIPLALVLLAGCAGEPANRQMPAQGDPFQNQLQTMPEGQRNAVFIRAVRDSGQQCQHVESSTPGSEISGNPTWTARCEGGASYTIVILPGGTAQVVNDAEARLADDNQTSGNGSQAR
ncbi:MAG: hypothetical protein AB7O91_05460 [Sphingomonas sp.]